MAVNLLRSETKEHILAESGATYLNKTKIHYEWKIHNFSLCPTEIGHALQSPTFPESVKDEYSWQLIAYPNGATEKYKDYLSLRLHFVPGKRLEVEAKCMFNILRDDKTEYYAPANPQLTKFSKENPLYYYSNFILRSKVFDSAQGILPDDILTIECDIIIVEDITNTANENNSDENKATVCPRLHNDLSDLLESPKFCDVTLITCGQEIQAHKAILAARSPVFAAMFNHEMKEQQENRVDITDVAYDVLKEMLRYVYTGKITNLDKMADRLLMAANKYGLKTLKDQCENALCKKMAVENAASLLLLGDLHSAGRLKAEALDFICTHTEDVLKTTSYQSLHYRNMHLIDETVQALANKRNMSKASLCRSRQIVKEEKEVDGQGFGSY